jgi:hypothetical protein
MPLLRVIVVVVAMLSLSGPRSPGEAVAADAPDAVHVLFIGNSFTFYHDLPQMLVALGRAGKQRPLVVQQETPGGCTLEKHWNDGRALALIRSRKWDYVVLQDQSQMPLLRPETLSAYGRKFDEAIRSAGAKTIFYQTWAPQDQPERQAAISAAYAKLARERRALLAPVGDAWQAASGEKRSSLYEKDGRHPSAAGSYLAACVFYATINGADPAGLPGRIAGLSDAAARALQAAAQQAVTRQGR